MQAVAKKRYAIVGVGLRSGMYVEAITETFADRCELVGLCDLNEGRLKRTAAIAAKAGTEVPCFDAADFEAMIAQTKPDCVVVAVKDCDHDIYILRAMELGCDVIIEKPLTTDEVKCGKILEAQRGTGRKITVTFNYRYAPIRTQVKDLLMSGVVGEVLSVDFHWLLDTNHGADYFRRWHRNRANSGSLLVHKATHHFDLAHWWLSDVPETVYATGSRKFYTPEIADRFGLTNRGQRCTGCPEAGVCKFYLDIGASGEMKSLYQDCESFDGYWRDKCIFNPEAGLAMTPGVDIWDTMNVNVKYAGGVQMSYSLFAYSPWEGYTISFNGTKGRLQHKVKESSYISGDGTVPAEFIEDGSYTTVFPHFRAPYSVDFWTGSGGHNGADPVMLQEIFAPDTIEPDKYKRAADQRSGAYSILTGVAAGKSILEGVPVNIADLVPDIGLPDYTPMPDGGPLDWGDGITAW